jgi:uncharacterized protein YhfF
MEIKSPVIINASIANYWDVFLSSLPADSPYRNKSFVAESFGDSPSLAEELGQLVAGGIKTATCSSLWEWESEGNPIPRPGLITVLLDRRGSPLCIIETTEVNICRFDEVDAQFAHAEGEGDLSLAYWRDAHQRYFARVLAKIKKEPATDMPLVCERFKVIYK